MDTLKCITSRRSRRLFLKKEVPDEVLDTIIECAVAAPSAQNKQPWHFVIVVDESKKKALAALKEEDNRQHILTAPISVLVCIDTVKSPNRSIEEGALASANILLAAHDVGLGSVYLTAYKPKDTLLTHGIREIFSLPEHIFPVSILPIGYPDPGEIYKMKNTPSVAPLMHLNHW